MIETLTNLATIAIGAVAVVAGAPPTWRKVRPIVEPVARLLWRWLLRDHEKRISELESEQARMKAWIRMED